MMKGHGENENAAGAETSEAAFEELFRFSAQLTGSRDHPDLAGPSG